MALKWWEKTVEYLFIKQCVGKRMLLAPLDGREEAAGDTLLGAENGWVLIEFKKDAGSIASEKEKFTSYKAAEKELVASDSHHFLVYGALRSDEGSHRLAIHARTYFSNQSVSQIGDLLARGIAHHDFMEYLEKFLQHKKSVGGATGGGVGVDSYSLVAGVNAEGNVAQCMSIAEFIETFMPAQSLSQTSTPSWDDSLRP